MDMVLFRFGSTGVWNVIRAAVNAVHPVIVYPVTSFTNYKGVRGGAFGTCHILHEHSTVTDLKTLIMNVDNVPCASIEAEDGRVMGEEDEIVSSSVVRVISRVSTE